MADTWNWNPNDELDDEDALDFKQEFSGRDGHIYLIDAHNFKNGCEHFKTTLDCIEAGLLNGISMNDRDLAGVVFYNTLHSPEPKRTAANSEFQLVVPKNMAIFMPMSTLNKDTVQYFKSFKTSDDFFDFENKYGTSTTSSFSETLWLCSRMFMSCGYKLRSSTITLFTDNEQPHSPGSAEYNQAMIRAIDLCKINANILLVPMKNEFDVEPFFKNFLCAVENCALDAFRLVPPEEQRSLMMNRVYQPHYRTTCERYLNVILADGLQFSCGIYNFIRNTKTPRPVKILSETNNVVVTKRSTVGEVLDKGTNEMVYTQKLMPGEIFKCLNVGGQEVIFSAEDVTNMRTLLPPGIRVLGFKPLNGLPERFFIKKSAFLYPDENHIKGSTKLFRALWEKCLEKKKYILCVLTYRRKAPPRYVALVPQTEDSHDMDGFRIVFLPMLTDYSHLEVLEKEAPEKSPVGEELFKKLCKKLKFSYKPELFTNPHFKTLYANIEALVFDETGIDVEDTTLPDTDYQDQIVGRFIDDLTAEFGKESFSVKRPRGGDTDGATRKVPKKSLTIAEIKEVLQTGTPSNLTVQNLKDFIQNQGRSAPPNALKKELLSFAQKIVDDF